jgi:hypothetical protein
VLRQDDAELKQLANKIAITQKAIAENARVSSVRESERNTQAGIERMNREGNALVEEYKRLTARSKNATLSASERTEAESAAKLKLAALQAKQREIKAFIESTRGAVPPQFQARAMEPISTASIGADSSREQWTAVDDKRASLRIAQADPAAIFSVYERLSGRKVIPDKSVAGVTGTFDLETEPHSRSQMMQVLRVTLRDQLNIWITPTPDGNAIATLGPPP